MPAEDGQHCEVCMPQMTDQGNNLDMRRQGPGPGCCRQHREEEKDMGYNSEDTSTTWR